MMIMAKKKAKQSDVRATVGGGCFHGGGQEHEPQEGFAGPGHPGGPEAGETGAGLG